MCITVDNSNVSILNLLGKNNCEEKPSELTRVLII